MSTDSGIGAASDRKAANGDHPGPGKHRRSTGEDRSADQNNVPRSCSSCRRSSPTPSSIPGWPACSQGCIEYFLQQAASVGTFAEQQLARAPGPRAGLRQDERPVLHPDRRSQQRPIGAGGRTSHGNRRANGSARLLEDISQLDSSPSTPSSASSSSPRPFSLATLAPVDLQRFQKTECSRSESGSATGGRRACIWPRSARSGSASQRSSAPAQGIRGTLTSGGTSRTSWSQRRWFPSAAPRTAAGNGRADLAGGRERRLSSRLTRGTVASVRGLRTGSPFRLELPRQINWFDYRTIAECRSASITPPSTAPRTPSGRLRQQPAQTSNSIALSLRDQLDAWYALSLRHKSIGGDGTHGGYSTPVLLTATWELGRRRPTDDTQSATAATAPR